MDYTRIVEHRNGRFQNKTHLVGSNENQSSKLKVAGASTGSRNDGDTSSSQICFNCGSRTHIAPSCPQPKRPKGACYGCGSTTHQRSACPGRDTKNKDEKGEGDQQQNERRYAGSLGEIRLLEPAYLVRVSVQFGIKTLWLAH